MRVDSEEVCFGAGEVERAVEIGLDVEFLEAEMFGGFVQSGGESVVSGDVVEHRSCFPYVIEGCVGAAGERRGGVGSLVGVGVEENLGIIGHVFKKTL